MSTNATTPSSPSRPIPSRTVYSRKTQLIKDRPTSNDRWTEPAWVSRRLLQTQSFPSPIWDPACGWGTIARNAPLCTKSYSSDLFGRGFGLNGLDFLKCKSMLHIGVGEPAKSIICNPPLTKLREFAEHALDLGAEKVAMLFPMRRLFAARWIEQTPLAKIILLSPRSSTSSVWLIWQDGYTGAPWMSWLHRDVEIETKTTGETE